MELTHLAGATSDANITVNISASNDPQVIIEVNSQHVKQQIRSISRDTDGKIYIENLLFERSNDNIRGFGAHSLATQIRIARRIGVDRIQTFAYRGSKDEKWSGYYAWARLGFDTPLSEADFHKLPTWLSNAKTMADIFETDEGRIWWKENGYPKGMIFDLNKDSESMKILEKYLTEKEYRINIYD